LLLGEPPQTLPFLGARLLAMVYREVAPKVGGDAAADAIPADVDTGTLIRIPPRSLLDYLHMFSHPPLARFYHCLRDSYITGIVGVCGLYLIKSALFGRTTNRQKPWSPLYRLTVSLPFRWWS
jgi:hypothetical protein